MGRHWRSVRDVLAKGHEDLAFEPLIALAFVLFVLVIVLAPIHTRDLRKTQDVKAAYLVIGYLAGHTMADCETLPHEGLDDANCKETRRRLTALARPLGVERLGTGVKQ